jgi:iron complex transport system substrate-binding protein
MHDKTRIVDGPIRRASPTSWSRAVAAIAVVSVASLIFTGCQSGETSTTSAPHDDFGTRIAFGKPPARIASLNPTTTEVLVALGAMKRLVGRSQYDTFPDSVKTVPAVGPALRPTVEAILAVHPDLVILYASADNRPAYDRLRAAGITTLAFKIDSIAQFERDTRLIGRLTGDSTAAATLVDTVSATLARVRAATASLTHPTVFYSTWDKPIIAIGGASFMSELFEIAGAENVYDDIHTPTVTVTIEDVVQRNPDFVLTGDSAAAKMKTNPMWRAVAAVHKGHILVIDEDVTTRPSVQLGMAAVRLAALLHPGAVK